MPTNPLFLDVAIPSTASREASRALAGREAGMMKRLLLLSGMTVNERLCATGLLGQWDVAVRSGDRETMLAVMREVEVEPPEFTVDAILANPAFYGF